ncbi:MAG: hypothetical protein ACLFV2_11410 [Desulfurivibrionaceae bacterium]
MAEEQIQFISYEKAMEIVGNIVEEEHLHEPDRRILTVYDKKGRELCWYDAEEVLSEVKEENPGLKDDDLKKEAVEVVMKQIPDWAVKSLSEQEDELPAGGCACSC